MSTCLSYTNNTIVIAKSGQEAEKVRPVYRDECATRAMQQYKPFVIVRQIKIIYLFLIYLHRRVHDGVRSQGHAFTADIQNYIVPLVFCLRN